KKLDKESVSLSLKKGVYSDESTELGLGEVA
ncbi:MAG: hypothetical protein QG581_271, partial [Patescibacteria group bacterium]|nr:hypothetical protein [Patescibacteria group bacterium]